VKWYNICSGIIWYGFMSPGVKVDHFTFQMVSQMIKSIDFIEFVFYKCQGYGFGSGGGVYVCNKS